MKRLSALLLFVLVCSLCYGQTLADVRDSIRVKGRKWVAGETSLWKLTDAEKEQRLGLVEPPLPEGVKLHPLSGAVPSRFNWAPAWVTPVRDQGACGSCWAFATAGALESNVLIRDNLPGIDNDRAEQLMISCRYGGTCAGGDIAGASYWLENYGIPGEEWFPYSATNEPCENAVPGWESDVETIRSWAYVSNGPDPAKVESIKRALAHYGPLIVSMGVYADFFSYAGGVYQYTTGPWLGGHAILLVGYEDNSGIGGGGFFIVKNSWGTGWGMQGYFQIAYSEVASVVKIGYYTIAYSPLRSRKR